MAKIRELTPEEIRRMQLLQLDMLIELDRVCREKNIQYAIGFGTLLGAVRHKGYIPWDDDADVVMLREEYEKFKGVADQLNPEICWFQDHTTDPEYPWGYGKLRRTGTEYIRAGQEHMKFKTGVGIDIFPMDDVPKFIPAQMFQNAYCYCFRKILWARVAQCNHKGLVRLWFSLWAKIPIDFVHRCINRYVKKSRNDTPNGVKVLMTANFGSLYRKNPMSVRYWMPKKWFKERAEYDFEGKKLMGIADYDAHLTYLYGDYMTPPPEEKRLSHTPVSSFKF